MLGEYLNQRRSLQPTFQPPPMVAKTIDYVQKFNCGTNTEALKSARA
jgi:DNA-directed RNA polymerase II subunit RPB4